MKPTAFDGSGPNRSGIRQASLGSDRFSGQMLRGIGRAIDRTRIVSSPAALIRETPGGTSVDVEFPEPLDLFPFRVDVLNYRDGSVSFRMEQGFVYGAPRAPEEPPPVGAAVRPTTCVLKEISVEIGETLTKTETAPTPTITGFLSNGNLATYSGPLSVAESTDLFVIIAKPSELSDYWTVKLELKPTSEAQSLSNVGIQLAKAFEVYSRSALPSDHNFSPSITGASPNVTVVISQTASEWKVRHSFKGNFVVPVARFKPNLGDIEFEQILRSDIFFPYGVPIDTSYIDTAISSVSVEDSCNCGGGGTCTCTCTEPCTCTCTEPCTCTCTCSEPCTCTCTEPQGQVLIWEGQLFPYIWGNASYVGEDGQTYWGVRYQHPDGNSYFTHEVPPPFAP